MDHREHAEQVAGRILMIRRATSMNGPASRPRAGHLGLDVVGLDVQVPGVAADELTNTC
jgi:hypothetical protein